MPWYRIYEAVPKSSGSYIVAGRMKYSYEEDYSHFVDLAYYNGTSWETYNDWYEGQDEYQITYWMPLPEYPISNRE